MSAIDNITNNSNTVEKDVGDQSTSKMPTKDSTTTTTTTNDSKIHRGSDPMDDTKMPAASDVTRSTSDFVVKYGPLDIFHGGYF